MSVSVLILAVAFAITVQWGIVAVAAALVVVTYLMAPAWLIAANRLLGLDFGTYLKQIGPPLIAGLVMMGAVFLLKLAVSDLAPIWQVVALVSSGLITYGAVLVAVAKPMAIEAVGLIRLGIPKRPSTDSGT